MAKWTTKSFFALSALGISAFASAMDIDFGNFETGSYVALDSQSRPILVGMTENPNPSIFAAAYRLNATNLWTTTIASSDPLGGYSRKPQVRNGKLIIPWVGAAGASTPNAGTIEVNATNGTLLSQSMTTGPNSVSYLFPSISANGTVYIIGQYLSLGSPNYVSSCLYQKAPTGAGSIIDYPGAPHNSLMFDDVIAVPGAIYVVGHRVVSGTPNDVFGFVTKIDPTTFAQVWTTEIHGPNNYLFPKGIAVDSSGNIVVGGTQTSVLGDRDVFYAKLNNAGTILGQTSFVYPSSNEDVYDFKLGPGGCLATAGNVNGQLFISTASNNLATVNLNVNSAVGPANCLATDSTSIYAASSNSVMRVDALCQGFWTRQFPAIGNILGMTSSGPNLFTAGILNGNAQLCRIDTLTGNQIW